MSQHKGENKRHQSKHSGLVFVGRFGIQLLLDIHGNTHNDRPDADV